MTTVDFYEGEIIGGNSIGRSVVLTHCSCLRVKDGEIAEFDAVLAGEFDEKNAMVKLRKVFEDQTIVVLKAETDVDYYTVPLNAFVFEAMKNRSRKDETDKE